MKVDTFANRLKKAMIINGFKQVDLVNKTKLDKSLINKYLSGVSEAGSDKLSILAEVLNVNEVYLMGYDVDINGNPNLPDSKSLDEFEILFDKYKDTLTESDKNHIKFIIEERKKAIDKELGEE